MGPEAGELRTEDEAELLQQEIDACGEEGGCEGEEDDVHFEADIGEWILPEQDPRNVACHVVVSFLSLDGFS